jgi:hypothetical protein
MKKRILQITLGIFSLMMAGCGSTATKDVESKTETNKTSTVATTSTETTKKETAGVPAEKACSIFEKSGIKGEYKKGEKDDDYSCYATKVAGKSGAQGFLTYLASGNQTSVNYMSVSMNNLMEGMEDFKGVDRRKLVLAGGQDLAKLVANQDLPKEIETAIMKSTPGEWKVGEATVTLKKDAGAGSMYELRLVFQL